MIAARVLLAALAAALAAGCGGQSPEVRSSEDAISEEVSELRAQRRRDRIRLREMEERMAELAAARSAAAELPDLPVERLEPAPVEGEIEVVGVEPDGTEIVYADDAVIDDTVEAPTDLLRGDADPAPRRARAARGTPPLELPEAAAGDSLGVTRGRLPTVGEVASSQAREPPPATRRPRPRPRAARTSAPIINRYQKLVATLRAGNHADAIRGLRRFLDRYPQSDYADNAQYWLGEAYYDQKQFRRALEEFERVVGRYPEGNKVPDALLKQAYCHLGLGDRAAATAILERLIADHPESRPADLARQKLEQIGD